MRPIALLTDFGLDDPYVGQMKAVLARLAPDSPILDVSHGVPPFDILRASFFLAASAPHFPLATIFLAVIDPGVGTARRLLLAEKGERLFLAPDNGLLALILKAPGPGSLFELPQAMADSSVAATFHGRDVLAPLAARLAAGEPPEILGRKIPTRDAILPEWSEPRREGESLHACVLHVDRFGNCILNVRRLESTASGVRIDPAGRTAKTCRTYGDLGPDDIGLLPGSQGFLELAANQGSAAERLGLAAGDDLTLVPER